jgi:hypothetical protein
MNFDNPINIVLRARSADTDMINVVEALGTTRETFQQAFDVALEMENRNLVKMLYSNYNIGKIVVELTLPGIALSKKLRG